MAREEIENARWLKKESELHGTGCIGLSMRQCAFMYQGRSTWSMDTLLGVVLVTSENEREDVIRYHSVHCFRFNKRH